MIRVKDIANMVGVSPTTVSNVIHGNTKRVSQETAQKISSILDEVGYIPNMGARLLSQNTSHIIGLVIGFDYLHGELAMQDPFVSTFVGQISSEIENAGYYMMIIRGDDCRKVAEVTSRWNVDGLIVLGWTEKSHKTLKKMLKKPTVAIDTYVSDPELVVNVGTDDFDGAYQLGKYWADHGFRKTLFLTENTAEMDQCRFAGFQRAMTEAFGECKKEERLILLSARKEVRRLQYDELLPRFREAGSLAFISDYLAIDAVDYFIDKGVRVPEDISITGFDDTFYAELIRPRLTTVHQNIGLKASTAMQLLLRLINREKLPEEERNIKIAVQLVVRESVRKRE